MGRFQGCTVECFVTTQRLHWVATGVRMSYVAGRAFVAGFSSPNIDRHGYKPGVAGANDGAGHSTVQNERLKPVQGAQSMKTRSVSVLTLQGHCCDHVGGRVHPA